MPKASTAPQITATELNSNSNIRIIGYDATAPSGQQFKRIPKSELQSAIAPQKITRSVSVPTSPQSGDIWDELDKNFQAFVIHRWVYVNNAWVSYNLQFAKTQFIIAPASADAEKSKELVLSPTFKGVKKPTIQLIAFNAIINNYNTAQDASNFWSFNVFGTNLASAENFWFNIDTKNTPADSVGEKEQVIGSTASPYTDFKRVRIQAVAAGDPGIVIANLSLSYIYNCT